VRGDESRILAVMGVEYSFLIVGRYYQREEALGLLVRLRGSQVSSTEASGSKENIGTRVSP
jgi:hypothetical protein